MKSWTLLSILAILIAGGAVSLGSCKHTVPVIPTTPINFVVPPGWPQPVYDFSANPLTEEGFVLGRKLFYDGRLSIDGNYPCSSCHQPVAAFTTFEHDRSHGYNHSHTLRNAPGLFNLAWYSLFNQDGSESKLETIYNKHITDPTEMAESMSHVIDKLNADNNYRNMFRLAFGDIGINEDRIYKALSQFLIGMVSANSRYDKVMRGEASFMPEEEIGYQIFQDKCSTCHAGPLFTDFSFRNTGMPVDPGLNDLGRFRVTGQAQDSFKFRVPSLRNLDFTSYYGHDGRFSLPYRMIDHYRFGVVNSTNVDPLVANGISLTDTERDNLVWFLSTLSDSTFLNSRRYRE